MASVLITVSITADAQSRGYYRADSVAFFKPVALGEIAVTPIGILKDKRCPDTRLCSFRDQTVISVIVDDGTSRREAVLELGQPVQVSGGLLVLTGTGVAPKWNGATHLSRYNLDLRYIPIG